jgi:hypothetical protein
MNSSQLSLALGSAIVLLGLHAAAQSARPSAAQTKQCPFRRAAANHFFSSGPGYCLRVG